MVKDAQMNLHHVSWLLLNYNAGYYLVAQNVDGILDVLPELVRVHLQL